MDNLPEVEIDKENVKVVTIPNKEKVLVRYCKIYNWYISLYQKTPDKDVCVAETARVFKVSTNVVNRAIDVCKYILATKDEIAIN